MKYRVGKHPSLSILQGHIKKTRLIDATIFLDINNNVKLLKHILLLHEDANNLK